MECLSRDYLFPFHVYSGWRCCCLLWTALSFSDPQTLLSSVSAEDKQLDKSLFGISYVFHVYLKGADFPKGIRLHFLLKMSYWHFYYRFLFQKHCVVSFSFQKRTFCLF
ncbi:hypothetical protein EB796_013862 [Bugula neritina]|uniref:Uncharacterized protein n=1 Tax=Bugula neritina TaxID=10212 RepID=A0A7J7JNC6_BUGNE|nr:hypothetical protein EB796_013862 [Bugula neritina]